MSYSLRVRCRGWPRLVDGSARWSETNLTDFDGSIFNASRSVHAAVRSADTRYEFADAEGLGDVIVGAKLESFNLFLFTVANCHHKHRKPGRKSANAAQRLNAADTWHVDVEKDNIDRRGMKQLQGFFAARRLEHLKPEFRKRRPECPANRRFVVNDENANCGLIH